MRELKEIADTLPETYSREYEEIVEYYSRINFDKLKKESVSMNNGKIQETFRTNMIKGYENMANINLSLADQAISTDNDALYGYESLLYSGREDSEY